MGIVDKFKNFMGYPDDEFYDEEEESYVVKQDEDDPVEIPDRKRSANVMNIHATTQLQVVLVKPERFEEASSIADHLNAQRTIVLNLEQANKDICRRLLDFLSGVAYANDGQVKKVANSTYIITPYNVGIMGDLLDELESNNSAFFTRTL